MKTIDQRMIAAWEEAASELGIRLESPFRTEDSLGNEVILEGFLPDFGGPSGMVIVSFSRRIKLGSLPLPISILPQASRKYSRKHFVSELRDWGWYGGTQKPDWMDGS